MGLFLIGMPSLIFMRWIAIVWYHLWWRWWIKI